MTEEYETKPKDPLFESDFLRDLSFDEISIYNDMLLIDKINILSKKIEERILMIKKQSAINKITESAIDDLVYSSTGLNTLEIALFAKNPSVGYKVFSCARLANDASSKYWAASTIHNGNGDAFRHCLWSGCLALATKLDYTLVEQWGNAHEDGTPNNPPLESSMDKYNNLQGMNAAALALSNPAPLEDVCLDYTKTGQLRIINSGELVHSTNEGRK
jgi:hypothetical protein